MSGPAVAAQVAPQRQAATTRAERPVENAATEHSRAPSVGTLTNGAGNRAAGVLLQQQLRYDGQHPMAEPGGSPLGDVGVHTDEGAAPAASSAGVATPLASRPGMTGGRPLPPELRTQFESQLGEDLTSVRLYTDAAAARAADRMHAAAFTVGDDVVFGDGQFSPSTSGGRELIGHEVAHVLQQRHGGPDPGSGPASPHEQSARAAGRGLASGERRVTVGAGTGRTVACQELGDSSADLDLKRAEGAVAKLKAEPTFEKLNEQWTLVQQQMKANRGKRSGPRSPEALADLDAEYTALKSKSDDLERRVWGTSQDDASKAAGEALLKGRPLPATATMKVRHDADVAADLSKAEAKVSELHASAKSRQTTRAEAEKKRFDQPPRTDEDRVEHYLAEHGVQGVRRPLTDYEADRTQTGGRSYPRVPTTQPIRHADRSGQVSDPESYRYSADGYYQHYDIYGDKTGQGEFPIEADAVSPLDVIPFEAAGSLASAGLRGGAKLLFADVAKNVGNTAAKDLAKAGTKQIATAGTKEIATAGTKEVATAGTTDLAKAGTKGATEAGVTDAAESGATALGKEAGTDGATDLAKGASGDAVKTGAADTVKTIAADTAKASSSAEARTEARAARTEELNAARKQNNDQISDLERKILKHEKQGDRYTRETASRRDRGDIKGAEKAQRQAANEARIRDGVQDEVNRLRSQNQKLESEIAELNRPPGTPQQQGLAAEGLITKASGWPKNQSAKFKTSFADARSPDGYRIPDFAPIVDKNGWRSAKDLADLANAECVADSKVLAAGGMVRLTPQIKGFIELAQVTKNRALLLITDQPVDATVYEFARQYKVIVRTMSQPY